MLGAMWRALARWVLAPLRRRRLFSLTEADRAMRPLLDGRSGRHSKHPGTRRRGLFERLDLPALRPLPLCLWKASHWESYRVERDGHFAVDGCRHSLPFSLIGKLTWRQGRVGGFGDWLPRAG